MDDGKTGKVETPEDFAQKPPAELFQRALDKDQEARAKIIEAVWERCKNSCSNCGYPDSARLRLIFVVPEEAGGRFQESNLTLHCRTCQMAAESLERHAATWAATPGSRLVNFYVSRDLYNRIDEGLQGHQGFEAKGALFRFLVEKFVQKPESFEDLSFYEDASSENSERVRIAIWIDHTLYSQFKEMVQERNMTVTSSLVSLVLFYAKEVEPQIAEKKEKA